MSPSKQLTVGIGVVGTGFGQKVHIPGFQLHPHTHVVAVYHREMETAKAIANTYDIPHACAHLSNLLALPQVQAVSLSTPPFLHYEMGKAIIRAGKHLLLEKPVTLTTSEAQELHQLAIKEGVRVLVDFEYRAVPAWQYLAELLDSGFVGKKRLIQIDWLMASRSNPMRAWNWYSSKTLGGGCLGALGSHTFDYVHWLFGGTKRLSAFLSTSIPTRPDPLTGEMKTVDAEDSASLTLELMDGVPCHINLSAVTHHGRGHWVEVYGDRGTIILGSGNQNDYVHGFQLWTAAGEDSLTEVHIPERLSFPQTYGDGRLAPFIGMIDRWVEAIESGQNPVPSLKEGVYSQLLMDLARESDHRRSWVEVPPF